MRTLYMLQWNCKCYISTNGMELLRFANWLGASSPVTNQGTTIKFIPSLERYS